MPQWRKWFWIAVCCSLLMRLLFAAALPLSNDEAYHWLWTMNPSPGYYDHPGLFAYILWPFTALLGNDHEWIIRIPSLISMTLFPIAVYLLAKEICQNTQLDREQTKRCAAQAGILATCIPFFFVMGMYHTGDATVYSVWAWALFAAYRALHSGSNAWLPWLGLGICTGLGLQAKYLFIMFIPILGACILLFSDFRHWALRPQPYVALFIGLLIFSPNLYWNYQHDWATFVFNFSARHDSEFELKHVIEFIFGTLMIGITPGLFIYSIKIYSQHLRPRANPALFFLAMFSLIPICYFLYRSTGQRVGMHWPAVSYIALIALGPVVWQQSGSQMGPFWKRASFWCFSPAIAISLLIMAALTLVSLYPQVLIRYEGDIKYSSRISSDKFNEIFGWEELGAWVAEIKQEDEFLIGPQYGFVAQLSFYTPDNPHVFVWPSGGVHGQHFKMVDDYAALKGKNALFVAKDMKRLRKHRDQINKHFASVAEQPHILEIKQDGKVVRSFVAIRCFGYSGSNSVKD